MSLLATAALMWRAVYCGITFDHLCYLDGVRMLVQMGPPMQLFHSQRMAYISYKNGIGLLIFTGNQRRIAYLFQKNVQFDFCLAELCLHTLASEKM